MTDNKLHTFELKSREGSSGLMAGPTSELLVDGVKMKGVRKVTVEVEAGEVARMTIQVVGKFHVLGQFSPVILEQQLKEKES
jgi:hypothetical protein